MNEQLGILNREIETKTKQLEILEVKSKKLNFLSSLYEFNHIGWTAEQRTGELEDTAIETRKEHRE